MAQRVLHQSRFNGGLAGSEKEGKKNSYHFGRSVNYRDDPSKITINPKAIKDSGTTVVDLPLWAITVGSDDYFLGNAGNFYKRTSAGILSNLRTIPTCSGNGLEYFPEDDYAYIGRNTTMGRYGPMTGTPSFVDDFLGQAAEPTNTYSLDLEASSSMSADAADSASLSITGDITLEASVKPESLPSIGGEMVVVSKWSEQSDERSYKMSLYGVAGSFGDGGDGALTISSNTTDAPIDSSAVGTLGSYSLTATNASFAAGQEILIHQTRGTGAGTYQRNTIQSYTAGTITLQDALNYSYDSTGANKAQVLVLKQYTNVTVNSGITWTAKAWDGTVGGILAFLANGTVTVTGTITATGKGFRGGALIAAGSGGGYGYRGEGTAGDNGTQQYTANGSGGGGGYEPNQNGGGGGGNGTGGVQGYGNGGVQNGGIGGDAAGVATLTTMVFGGGGGGGRNGGTPRDGLAGAAGGGIIIILGQALTVTGSVVSGGNSAAGGGGEDFGGGGGAGGSILLRAVTATLGTALITAPAGLGSTNCYSSRNGGNGAVGRIHIDYATSYTGTTTPTIDTIQNTELTLDPSYHLRLYISSTGANTETYTKRIPSFVVDFWRHLAVAFDASASTCYFYASGVSLGQATGTLTAIYDGTALLALGADYDGAGATRNFLDGKIDEVRVWNTLRTSTEISANYQVEISVASTGLQAYYSLDNAATDGTANANNLTLRNTPTYSTDTAFSGGASGTARGDIDQYLETSGNTYTVPTAISEAATARQTFVPTKDPQKSIEVLVAAKGTGDWTLTVHDSQNNTLATATIANANVVVGDNEFVFTSVWRPLIGKSYHFHLTSTVADGTVTTTTASDLETVDFHAYYQFLVDDEYHPTTRFLNFLAIGNERYVAKWDAITYNPHKVTLPSGYRVRCFARFGDYLAIGTWRGSTISSFEGGKIFFWDGVSATFNIELDVPEGGINAMINKQGILYYIAGSAGDIFRYNGVSQKIRRIPKMTEDTYQELAPSAITIWRSLLRFGPSLNSDSTAIEKGVYSWGSMDSQYTESMSYDYPISTGTRTGNTLKIGVLHPKGTTLFVGWQDGSDYGIDKITTTNDPYPTATIELLIFDNDQNYKTKKAKGIKVTSEALRSGESYTIKYKKDRDSSWSSGDDSLSVTTVGQVQGSLPIQPDDARFEEFQIAVDMATSGSTSPAITSISLVFDDNAEEEQLLDING
jgi:hypothetical protein